MSGENLTNEKWQEDAVPAGLAYYREDHIRAVIEAVEEYLEADDSTLQPAKKAEIIILLCEQTQDEKNIFKIKDSIKELFERNEKRE